MPSRLVKITYLEMFEPPSQPNIPLPSPLLALQSVQPTASYYRYLYGAVGAGLSWFDRRTWSDEELLRQVRDANVEVWVLYYAGTPAGYCELEKGEGEVNLSYFGLMPDFLGRGLGRLWLGWTLHQAWQGAPKRVWLHTCELDHPAALPLYEKLGLQPYKQVSELRQVEDQA